MFGVYDIILVTMGAIETNSIIHFFNTSPLVFLPYSVEQ